MNDVDTRVYIILDRYSILMLSIYVAKKETSNN